MYKVFQVDETCIFIPAIKMQLLLVVVLIASAICATTLALPIPRPTSGVATTIDYSDISAAYQDEIDAADAKAILGD